ncbi:NADP oxidoreductase [Nocardia panacis]|uniref:NADP oxidoreductase n=1 Tax=Nocardia panacis TaxID=2340916 RepID=A0A3A4KSN9_9NOCA|nr:NAD(P)-binding domain-containing protein [Nocardia panacis]RJO76566.1 NADP oxidoreductase [Nocardia panacis]
MRIGIIGAGAMARALGAGWVAAGHEIRVGARDVGAAEAAARELGGARAGTIAAAVDFGEVLLPAIPPSAWDDVLRSAPEGFTGKVLIDCSNAFIPDAAAGEGMTAFVLSEEAVPERIAASVPGASVVKAFNLCAAEVWASPAREFEGRRLGVPLCGDENGVRVVSGLIEDLRLRPMPAGGLHQARYLEAMSVLVVGLWFAGHDPRAALPPLDAAFAEVD